MSQATAMVTLVGLSAMDPAKRDVEIGDELYLEKDLNNPDPCAIRVFLSSSREPVGYVGNREGTVLPGTLSAKDAYGLFANSVYGKVVNTGEVTFKNGRTSKGFVVELKLMEAEGENAMDKVIKFKLVGAKSQYPNKFRVIEDLKNGKTPYVKLYMQDDKIVAEYEGGLAGYVEMKNQDGLSDYDDIVASIGDEQIAKILQAVATNVIGEFKVNTAELAKDKSVRTLKSVCQQIIDDGLATETEIEERISYMEKYGVTEKQMLGVFGTYKRYDDEVAKRIPLQPETLYQDNAGILKRTIGYVNAKRNLMFEGDKGVGKNVLTETLAWLYKRPLYEFSMNSQHDNTSLLGGKTIESDEEGKTKMGFDLEATIEAAIVGGVLVLDEFNTSLAHAMSIFNSLLDDRRRIQVPGYGLVKADPNFFAIAAQNRDYQGTFDNNEATADRFVPIIFPKLESLKEVLLAKVPHVGLTVINQCEELYLGIKKVVEDGEISDKAITIRGFIDACLSLEHDIPLKDALIDNVANRCIDLDDRKSVKNLINAKIG